MGILRRMNGEYREKRITEDKANSPVRVGVYEQEVTVSPAVKCTLLTWESPLLPRAGWGLGQLSRVWSIFLMLSLILPSLASAHRSYFSQYSLFLWDSPWNIWRQLSDLRLKFLAFLNYSLVNSFSEILSPTWSICVVPFLRLCQLLI